MPRRTDLKKILIIGAGPIVIGQACEFDYSGTQACKALRSEGYEVVLLNSNPATIMTDPETADRTYVEPVTPEVLEAVVKRERPDALLATMGGQTALNTAVAAAEAGVLERCGVEMIGADLAAIRRAEDRDEFRSTMGEIGVAVPASGVAHSLEEARAIAGRLGFPLVVRPAFTLGGRGGGMVYNAEEFETAAARGLEASPITEILVEESVIGWKEFELEVMRDRADNVVIICSIENVDPMGVHTGDSVTVAPAQTLTDREYQAMRDEAIAIIRAIGVETGGSNVQFAVDPATGARVAIEINPRVSRSSALASKATGFPIAKFAAKLAVGYTLDEIPNDITRETPASFEPAIDYVVVKAPRFTFEKFRGASDTLGISMQSVGETMAIGRTFPEALQKALRGLETGLSGLDLKGERLVAGRDLEAGLVRPTPERLFFIKRALKEGMPLDAIADLTRIDPWFLREIGRIVELEREIGADGKEELPLELHRRAKRLGFSDRQIAELTGSEELAVCEARRSGRLAPVHKLVDTCAAEFEAHTPYFYSTYETEDEGRAGGSRRILILGGGPNRIGQGIEFDYCCCHAAFAIREFGCEAIMVNSNPETVSTDYDTSDRLYFEPLTREDVLAIIEAERPDGVIVQLGGQTPLNLAVPLERAGVRILGTSPEAIDRASDRGRFKALVEKLGLAQPENGTAFTFEEARAVARAIRYPVIVRPSYVLGGRAMEIVYDEGQLEHFMKEAVVASTADRKNPVLIDKFLEDAIEVDVDAVADGARCVIGAIMEHIEEAGIHSGDSSCVIPPHTLSDGILDEIRRQTRALALELGVRGLMNVQYAVRGSTVYILEVNPRASRTVPFVSKAIGVPLVNIATKVMLGSTLEELGFINEVKIDHVAVKAPVFPFARFRGADAVLGPEMRSTGEVMGVDSSSGLAFAKALQGAGGRLPLKGNVFFSIRDADKRRAFPVAKQFADLGFRLAATPGTAAMLRRNDIEVREIFKITGGRRPNIIDLIKNGEVQLIINTPSGKTPRQDEVRMRSTAVGRNIPLITTLAGAQATVQGIEALRRRGLQVRTLQEYGSGYTPPKMMQPVRAAGG